MVVIEGDELEIDWPIVIEEYEFIFNKGLISFYSDKYCTLEEAYELKLLSIYDIKDIYNMNFYSSINVYEKND